MRSNRRSGFTLIEMLVVIVILLIVFSLGWVVVNSFEPSENVGGASNILYTKLVGVRDRAIHDQQPRGLRILPSADGKTSNSITVVGASGRLSAGILHFGSDRRTVLFDSVSTQQLWQKLYSKKILSSPARIKLELETHGAPLEYVMLYDGTNWKLTRDLIGPVNIPEMIYTGDPARPYYPFPKAAVIPNWKYEVKLQAAILPNVEVMQLPRKAVIDLVNSDLPVANPDGSYDLIYSENGVFLSKETTIVIRHVDSVIDNIPLGEGINDRHIVLHRSGAITTRSLLK